MVTGTSFAMSVSLMISSMCFQSPPAIPAPNLGPTTGNPVLRAMNATCSRHSRSASYRIGGRIPLRLSWATMLMARLS